MTAVVGRVEGERKEWTLFVGGDIRDLRDYPMLVKPKAEGKSDYQIATFRLEGKKRELRKLYLDAYLPEQYRNP
jgi:hypothetical protein